VSVSTMPLFGSGEGKAIGAIVIFVEVTERKRAEKALQEANLRLEERVADRTKALEAERTRLMAIINSAPQGVVVTDEKARIVLTNDQANRLYARPVPYGEDYESHADLQICSPDGTPYEPRDLPLTRSALNGKVFTNLEMLILWPDGQRRSLLVNTAPVYDTDGRIAGAVGIFQDISQIKQAEEEVALYAKRLEQSNRDLEAFAFVASHDLNEPLRKVQAFSKYLLKSAERKLDQEERDYLSRLNIAAERMSAMLRDLLDYSRISTKAKAYNLISLISIMSNVMIDLEFQIERSKAQIEIGDLPIIEGDEVQMRQLFQNLIGNAIKFSKPGVPPYVIINSKPIGKAIRAPGPGEVEICVEDNGIGFDPRFAETIFQPFKRLVGRKEYEGSGIGLSICQKIVERHGGVIIAESIPGEGAVFKVRLPIRQNQSQIIEEENDENSVD
jgi:signal transduction histidine kinase